MYKLLLFVFITIFIQNKINAQQSCSKTKQLINTPIIASQKSMALNSISDTVDILHYEINLNIADIASKQIKGNCRIQLSPKINNLAKIAFDLENLQIDSIYFGNQNINTYTYQTPKLQLQFPQNLSKNDTVWITVYYKGSPKEAGTGFGGFYWASNYAYNLGVGIGVDPPVIGRYWFPCLDNFVEKSTYTFNITTANNCRAFCNGLLTNTLTNADNTKTWTWEMKQPIPTYLASVAVSTYTNYTDQYLSPVSGKTIPMQFGVLASDTNKLKQSFANLKTGIAAFEKYFGAYPFDRIGYSFVPFNGGAMEHATNITFPRMMIDGTLNYEDIMAHEFSHHWFGDLVTCESAEDMWLNEGWASYCENLFFEAVYGKERYKQEVRKLHARVVQYASYLDGNQYLPISGVPFDYTYGFHVYSKGADAAHTLRGYMGDSLFFNCVKKYLQTYSFKNANSHQFKDFLVQCSGNNNINDFFNDIIFGTGNAHFSIDSINIQPVGDNFNVSILVKQRLYHAANLYSNVPLDVTFFTPEMTPITKQIIMNGTCEIFNFTFPFYPVYTALDLDEKISDATIDELKIIKNTGTFDYTNTNIKAVVTNISDSAYLRVIHNFATPDRPLTPEPNLVLSPNHYWKIEGVALGNLEATLEFNYNGTTNTSTGYLDNNLIIANENNIKLLYRPTAGYNWTNVEQTLSNGGNATDKKGKISTSLQFGEYVLAYNQGTDTITTPPVNCIVNNVSTTNLQTTLLKVYPNPSKNAVKIEFLSDNQPRILQIFDVKGGQHALIPITPKQKSISLSTDKFPKGFYLLQLTKKEVVIATGKLQVIK